MFLLFVFIHEKENWQFFPPSVTRPSTMPRSRAVMYPERGTIAQITYHHRDLQLILVKM